MKFIVLVLSLMFVGTAHAAKPGVGKSAKKIAADKSNLTPPQVLEPGDNMIGLRANQGDVFDHKPLIGVNYERMLTTNFGVGGQFFYTEYQTNFNVNGFRGTWDYEAYVFAAYGSFHFDIFKVKNFDTYISAGVGRTQINSKWHSNDKLPASSKVDTSSMYLLGYVTGRYFVNSNWAFSGSLGLPIGTLSLGMDYLF